MLKELNQLPPGLLDLAAPELHSALGGPTLLSLKGMREPPLFVSVLIHGNETTGWEAIRQLLQQYEPGGGSRPLPRTLWLFIANTLAAEQGLRHLPGQPDFNRIWPGTEQPETGESLMMQNIIDKCRDANLFASVDIHNNTGLNPHYGCINQIRIESMHLASMFSRTLVYFTRPVGVQSIAFSELCPAVTLECGKVGQQHSTDHAREFIDACLHLSEHPAHPIASQDVDVFHTRAVVKILDHIDVGFSSDATGLCLRLDLERLNFRELPAGTSLGTVGDSQQMPLRATDIFGADITSDFFAIEQGRLVTRAPLMPSMLTPDVSIMRSDCLCYLMERYDAQVTRAYWNTQAK